MSRLRRAAAAVAVVLLAAGCSTSRPASQPGSAAPDRSSAPDRGPAPVTVAGLRVLAQPQGDRLALHTTGGDVTFWTGVNLGSTTPGHSPGELAVGAADYRRWLGQMHALGLRTVRVYTIHPPALYDELAALNRAHPGDPLYLVQGVYLPDESYVESGDLYAAGPTRAFDEELRDASAAVHGDLVRPRSPGRASGTWTTDVSAWVSAWVVGVEWDPHAVDSTDRRHAAAPDHRGRYFSSSRAGSPQGRATPTARWLAARMDTLAGHEAAAGTSAPVAFVNWPTTDPLDHPDEPLESEDLAGVDARHVVAEPSWPGGTFASFHAYPYYPDVLRHDRSYARALVDGEPDGYAGYLADLRRHFAGMPVLVTETGVPSSLGSAHEGTRGRDQGGHTEAVALTTDAELLGVVHGAGLGGAFVFSWTDEWFKTTWNTQPRQSVVHPERRALWHDPLTNEQWFGLVAHDPVKVGRRVLHEARDGVREVAVDHDASWLWLDVTFAGAPAAPVTLGWDVLPGGVALPGSRGAAAYDVAVVVDPGAGTATALVRHDVDPLLLDGQESLPAQDVPGWRVQRLSTNRTLTVRGVPQPAEYQTVGVLERGALEPGTTATWQLDGERLRLRLPWSMLLLGDPSSKVAVRPVDGRAVAVPVDGLGLRVQAQGWAPVSVRVDWEGWSQVRWTERVKPGATELGEVARTLR